MLSDLFSRIGTIASRHPAAMLALALLLSFAAVQGAGMIGFASGSDTFIQKDTQIFQTYDTYKENFLSENIVLLVETDDVTAPKEIRAIKRFDKTTSQIEGVENVFSVADVAAPGETVPNHPEIVRRLDAAPPGNLERVMPDTKRSFVLVELEQGLSEEQTRQTYPRVQDSARFAEFPAGTSTLLTGSPVFGLQMQGAMQRDLGAMFGAAALLMVLALTLFFANVEFRLLPLLIVLVGVFWTFGGMGFLAVPMTMVSMAIFPILVGIGIDYAVQFHSRVQEEMEDGSASDAIPTAYRTTGPAVLVALVATGLGFVAMMTSPIPMIGDFGMMSLIGVVAAFLAVIILLVPTYLLLGRYAPDLSGRIPSAGTGFNPLERMDLETHLGNAALTAAKHPVLILLASTVLMAGGYAVSDQVDVEIQEEALIPQDMPALLNIQKFQDLGGGGRPIAVVVKGDVLAPETLEWMRDFEKRQVEKNPYFVGHSSIADSVAAANGGEIPDSRSEVERIVENLPDVPVESQLEGNSQAVVRLDLPGFIGFEKFMDTINALDRDLRFNRPPPGVSTAVTGDMVLMTTAFDAIATGRTFMSVLALGLIFVALTAIYRDPVKALVPLIPLAFVIGWNGAAMFLTGTDYTPLTATLGALTIGVGSEYTILMMERYFEEREDLPPLEAMETAASKIGRAITVSGLTTVFGFSALMASDFPMVQNFGKVTVITVLLALLAAFVVLPPVVVGLDRWRGRGIRVSLREAVSFSLSFLLSGWKR
ncbi:MAG: hypothetical protein MAG715_01025 [Methanonatronarchaeales archaeon]|nr:hypothetical protein [Methanonatronarchaeales archaeon]